MDYRQFGENGQTEKSDQSEALPVPVFELPIVRKDDQLIAEKMSRAQNKGDLDRLGFPKCESNFGLAKEGEFAGKPVQPDKVAKKLSEEEAAILIDRLGDKSFVERRNAQAALRQHGAEALPYLKDALNSADREVARSAAMLIGERLNSYREPSPSTWLDKVDSKRNAATKDDGPIGNPPKLLEQLKGISPQEAKTRGAEIAMLNDIVSSTTLLKEPEDRVQALAQLDGWAGEMKALQTEEGRKEFQKRIDSVTSLDLSGSVITDAGLALLKEFPNLRSINLQNAKISADGVANLAKVPSLKSLNLSGVDMTDRGFEHLGSMLKLEKLSLSSTGMTDQHMEQLRSLKSLKSLDVSGGQVGSVSAKPNEISAVGLEKIKDLPSLETLKLRGTEITDKHSDQLRKMQSLQYLQIENASNERLKEIQSVLPKVEVDNQRLLQRR